MIVANFARIGDEMKTKICAKCKQEKPVTEFHRCGRRRSGAIAYRPICRDCTNASKRADSRDRFFTIISGGGYFRGKLPVTGFVETVKAGYFPSGMVVRRGETVYEIDGDRMRKLEKIGV